MWSFIKNFINKNPVIAIIIAGVLIYLIIVWISGWIKKQKAKKNYNVTLGQAQDALNQLATQGIKPSYSQVQYSNWADSLEQAFSGCGAGWLSVGKGIFNNMKNEADVHALIQNYKIREIEECGWGSFEGDLGATIGYKFSGWRFCDCVPLWNCDCENCGCVNEINKILESKGIVFRF